MMVEVHSGPLAAQTEDPETISTGEVKSNSVDWVEGALTLTGNFYYNLHTRAKILDLSKKLHYTKFTF